MGGSAEANLPFMSTDEEALAAIESTYDTLPHWFARLRSTYVPHPKSDLAIDDADWPYMPVSQVAWVGLAGAADHLDAVRDLLAGGKLFSFAQLTLCRSALVGAAQAVWVLAPDDRTLRLKRARLVAAYVYTHRLKYFYELRKLESEVNDGIEFHVSKDEVRLAQLQAKRTADGQSKKDILRTGEMIEQAVTEAFGRDTLTTNANLSWQSGSGAAHGQVWPHFNTPSMRLSGLEGNGTLAAFAVRTTPRTFANHYSAAFETAERGWELLDKRGIPWASEM